MSTPADKEWFIEAYDKIVTDSGDDGSVVEKSRDAVAHLYLDGIQSGKITPYEPDPIEEARSRFDQFVMPVRDRRKQSMKKSMEYLIDLFNDPDATILGADDPQLCTPFARGDGTDKILSKWSAEDWVSATTERYRNSAKVTASAAEFDSLASEIITLLRKLNGRVTGDLFLPQPK